MNEATKPVLQACRKILANADKPALNYAVNYADYCAQMVLDNEPIHDIKRQVLYVLNNISGWRGEEAKAARQALKSFAGVK